jgi:hypothetical protein
MSTHKDEDMDSQKTLEAMHSNSYISNRLHALTIILLGIVIFMGMNIQGKLDEVDRRLRRMDDELSNIESTLDTIRRNTYGYLY